MRKHGCSFLYLRPGSKRTVPKRAAQERKRVNVSGRTIKEPEVVRSVGELLKGCYGVLDAGMHIIAERNARKRTGGFTSCGVERLAKKSVIFLDQKNEQEYNEEHNNNDLG